MNRLLMGSAFALTLLLASAAPALAQGYPGYYRPGAGYYNPGGNPQLSPYLNMLRGNGQLGNSVNNAANYFSGVVPEIERRADARRFSNAISELNREVTNIQDEEFPTLSQTGHAAVFANTGPFYPASPFRGNLGTTQQRPQLRNR